MQLKCCTHIYFAQNNSPAHTRHISGISIHIEINVRSLVCMRLCLWWRERLVRTSKRQWSLVLPSDKAGKLLFVIKDPRLTPCYLSSWVLSFALALLQWVTEERPLKKSHYHHQIWACLFNLPWLFARDGFIALIMVLWYNINGIIIMSNFDMTFEWKHQT